MNETLIGIVASILTIIIGLFKFVSNKVSVENKRIEEAEKLIAEGVNENDTAKITIGFDRLRNRK